MSNLNLHDYQLKARSTAAPVGLTYEYLAYGLLGEVGELAGRIAKGLWKEDTGTPEYYKDLALEYGDVAWMTAILLYKQGITGRDAWGAPDFSGEREGVHPIGRIAFEAGYMFRMFTGGQFSRYIDARHLWDLLETHCHDVTRYEWEQVLQMNLDKLASRANRGVLVGDGDHR